MFSIHSLMVKNKHKCQRKLWHQSSLPSPSPASSLHSFLLWCWSLPCLWKHPPLLASNPPLLFPALHQNGQALFLNHWCWAWPLGLFLLWVERGRSGCGSDAHPGSRQQGGQGLFSHVTPPQRCSKHIFSLSHLSKERGSHPLNGTLSLHSGPRSPEEYCDF